MRPLATAIVLAIAVGTAHADDVRPLVLSEHEVAIAVTAETSLQSGSYLTPLSIAPDLWFGVTARWTVGVIHSDATIDRIGTGAGMCVQCDRAYRGGGVEIGRASCRERV